jgi:hypothetical protein
VPGYSFSHFQISCAESAEFMGTSRSVVSSFPTTVEVTWLDVQKGSYSFYALANYISKVVLIE